MLWVKALHVIAVIAWMAALLYLPRLMVYHSASAPGSEQSETFKVMERRLLYAIDLPAMIAAWLFGLWMVWLTAAWREQWFWAKAACVLALTAYNLALVRWVGAFAADRNVRSTKFYRAVNEVPAVLMVAIVLLVIVKPF
jgi:putative membrane protein